MTEINIKISWSKFQIWEFPNIFKSLPASSKCFRHLMTFVNNLDPDETPQNIGALS